MYYIIYLSAGTRWFDKPELEELVQKSIENNKKYFITYPLIISYINKKVIGKSIIFLWQHLLEIVFQENVAKIEGI